MCSTRWSQTSTPEEGGRSHDVDLRNPRYPYEMLADFGLACTEGGHKRYCATQVTLNEGPGYIKLGVEQSVLVGLYWPDEVVKPDAPFDFQRD
jgi:hypothetical protein